MDPGEGDGGVAPGQMTVLQTESLFYRQGRIIRKDLADFLFYTKHTQQTIKFDVYLIMSNSDQTDPVRSYMSIGSH